MKVKFVLFFVSIWIFCFFYKPVFVHAQSGRFGVALGTWNFSKLQCYDMNGGKIDCKDAPIHYRYPFNDMKITSYDQYQDKLSKSAFNVGSFSVLDPSANTQSIWIHYEDYDNPWVYPAGKFSYTDFSYTPQRLGRETTNYEGERGAHVYATSGAPGAVRVRIQYEPGTNIHNRCYDWRIRLPKIIYKEGYPYCEGCIFKEDDFYNFLDENIDFDDGNGNWYALYLMAETDYGICSHYLEPYEYAAVFNEYVEKLKTRYPRIRFILESPVGGFTDRYEPYFRDLYGLNGKTPLLTPESRAAVSFNSIDVFLIQPLWPDNPITNSKGSFRAITDNELNGEAERVYNLAEKAGKFFNSINQKETLLTQVGVFNYVAVNPEPDSLKFGSAQCHWCLNNDDVWKTTEYGTARLAQLFFTKLQQRVPESHIQAWSYWGNTLQSYWKDPLINKTWGGLNHGIYWLSWNSLATKENGCTGQNYCTQTCEVWPTRVGMVYLKMANGDFSFVPEGAPSWWPRPSTTLARPTRTVPQTCQVCSVDATISGLISWYSSYSINSIDSKEDFNCDGKVDVADLIDWYREYKK